jgi:hypothetical protein
VESENLLEVICLEARFTTRNLWHAFKTCPDTNRHSSRLVHSVLRGVAVAGDHLDLHVFAFLIFYF